MNWVLALSAATTVVFILAAAPALASSAGTGEKEPHTTAALYNPDNQYALGKLKPNSPKFADNDRDTSRQGEVGRKHADGLQKGSMEKPSFPQRRSAAAGLELTHRG